MKTILTLLLMTAIPALAEPPPCRWRLPGMFTENMVLQRDVPLPVWGWGPDGETVTVRLIGPPTQKPQYDAKVETVVKNGRWEVTLPAAPAGGPYSFLVQPRDESLKEEDNILFTQVMVGEVWLICGQSNVLWPLDETAEGAAAIASAHKYPHVRILEICHRRPHEIPDGPRVSPVSFWGNPRWESAPYLAPRSSRKDIPGGPSAVGYYFSTALADHFEGKIPVGLIYVGAIIAAQTWVADDEVAQTPGLLPIRRAIYPNATSKGFEANIAPLARYPLRGFIYMQGESNCIPGQDEYYRHALPAIIRSWRRAWGNDALPFMIVQLGAVLSIKVDPNEMFSMDEKQLRQWHDATRNNARPLINVREAQRLTRQTLPRTGLVVTLDIGDLADAQDAHPKHKKAIGDRLALLSRRLAYGEKEPLVESPLPEKADFGADKVVVHFLNAEGGLVVRGEKPVGFEIAGADGVFHPAEVTVTGASITARSAAVKQPQTLRYAWAGYPQFNLYNKAGLPASPFEMRKESW